MLEKWFKLNITQENLKLIIGTTFDDHNPDVDYDPSKHNMDIADQRIILDLICNHYIGRPFPRKANEVDVDSFYNDLTSAIAKDN
jgi:hypothetical protein